MRKTSQSFISTAFISMLIILISGCGNNGSKAKKEASDQVSETKFKLIELPDEKRVDVLRIVYILYLS